MPALDDSATLAPIHSPTSQQNPRLRRNHPSPLIDGLALEIMSPRERAYWGLRFGIDLPYLMAPLGWGEWAPLIGDY